MNFSDFVPLCGISLDFEFLRSSIVQKKAKFAPTQILPFANSQALFVRSFASRLRGSS